MALPISIEKLFNTKPAYGNFSSDPIWVREASTSLNANLFRVQDAPAFLIDDSSDNKLYTVFKKTIRKKENLEKLLDEARLNLKSDFLGPEFDWINQQINSDFNHIQLYKCLKGELQLLSKAILSIAIIDVFRKNNGLNTPAESLVFIRPIIFSLSGFTPKILKKNFTKNKRLFNELKQHTNQIDRFFMGFINTGSGTKFFKEISKGKACSIVTASTVMEFLELKILHCQGETSLSQKPLEMSTFPARFER